jgi:anti-anti-sigma factor
MSDLHPDPGIEILAERPAPNVVLLRLTGKLDLWTSVSLMESIIAANAEHPELIAVDMSEAMSIDALGLRVLGEGARHLEDGGVHFAIISPAGHELARLPQLADLHRLLNVHESMDDVMRPLSGEAGEIRAGA